MFKQNALLFYIIIHYYTLTGRRVTSKFVTSVHLWMEEGGQNQWKCITYPKKRVHKLLYILLTTIPINLKLNYVLVDNVFLNQNRISSSSSNTIHEKVSCEFCIQIYFESWYKLLKNWYETHLMCCAGYKDKVYTAETKLSDANEEVNSFSRNKKQFCDWLFRNHVHLKLKGRVDWFLIKNGLFLGFTFVSHQLKFRIVKIFTPSLQYLCQSSVLLKC